MEDEDYTKYYDILELHQDASLSDIKRAYRHLKDLYSTDSIVTSPLTDEFPEDNRKEVIDLIEEAYRKLVKRFQRRGLEKGPGETAPLLHAGDILEFTETVESYTGPVLKSLREKMGIELHDISLATKIRSQYLEAIELEQFGSLPPEIYTRGFVIEYARYLSLNPDRVAHDVMLRYKEWKDRKEDG